MVPLRHIKRSPGFGEAKAAYEAIYVILNYIQWVLVSGTVYYFVSKYDKTLADSILLMLLSTLMYPVSSMLSIIVLGAVNVHSYWLYIFVALVVSIVIALFGYQYLIRVVEFIAAHQGGS